METVVETNTIGLCWPALELELGWLWEELMHADEELRVQSVEPTWPHIGVIRSHTYRGKD